MLKNLKKTLPIFLAVCTFTTANILAFKASADVLPNDTTLDRTKLYDFNADGKVTADDVALVSKNVGLKSTDQNWDARYDLNNDNVINTSDIKIETYALGLVYPTDTNDSLTPPTATPKQFEDVIADEIGYSRKSTHNSDFTNIVSKYQYLYHYDYIYRGILHTGKSIANAYTKEGDYNIVVNYLNAKYNYDYRKDSSIRSSVVKYVQLNQIVYINNDEESYMNAYLDKYFKELKANHVVTTCTVLSDKSLNYGYFNGHTTRVTLKIKYSKETSPTYMKKYGLEYNKYYYIDKDIEISLGYPIRTDIHEPLNWKPVAEEVNLTNLRIR